VNDTIENLTALPIKTPSTDPPIQQALSKQSAYANLIIYVRENRAELDCFVIKTQIAE
jgi:hypothetical protein